MKKRTGWTVKPNPDFASGFKNNGPYYQEQVENSYFGGKINNFDFIFNPNQANTNLSGGDYSCVQGSTKHCKVKAATNEGGYDKLTFPEKRTLTTLYYH